MNNSGQVMLSIYFAAFIFLIGIVFINFLKPEVTEFRTNMSCSDVNNISDGTKVVCLLGDIVVLYWIVIIVSASGGAILNKLLT